MRLKQKPEKIFARRTCSPRHVVRGSGRREREDLPFCGSASKSVELVRRAVSGGVGNDVVVNGEAEIEVFREFKITRCRARTVRRLHFGQNQNLSPTSA